MTLLVLNRRRIVDQILPWLADVDPDVVLVTARSVLPDAGSPGLRGYREVAAVADYDAPAVTDLVLELARRHRVDRILGTAEVDVLRAARVRETLGLPGQSVPSALAYRDKFRMKSLLAEAGLPVAAMRLVGSAAELRQAAREYGFPLVVKPAAGAGSVGVRVVPDAQVLENLVATDPTRTGPLLAEEWVSGSLYHVDGIFAGGKVVQSWASSMRYSNLDTVRACRPFISWMRPPGDPLGERLRDLVATVVGVLPAPAEATAFHAEVFHDPADRLMLCEIACRPGGGGIVPTYERALGVNLYAASLRGQAGRHPQVALDDPSLLAGFGWFPPRAGTLRELPRHCPVPGVYRYTPTGRVGHAYAAPGSISDTVAQALVAGDGLEDLDDRMAELETWWQAACRWDPSSSTS